jgi:hypothetical protein
LVSSSKSKRGPAERRSPSIAAGQDHCRTRPNIDFAGASDQDETISSFWGTQDIWQRRSGEGPGVRLIHALLPIYR